MDINIELCASAEQAPMEILLLADETEELVKSYLHGGECYVAKIDNDIVGAMVLFKTRPRTIEIMNIAVKEEYQNRGIGRQLIMFAIQKAKQDKMMVIEIGTGNPAVKQLHLYQKCGFRIVGIDFDYFRHRCGERIYENGIECRDMIRLRIDL